MQEHRFNSTPNQWPHDAPAYWATLTVAKSNDDALYFALTAGEWRKLVRVALMGLGYTTIKRSTYERRPTWEHHIEQVVNPAMKMIEALFPKKSRPEAGERSFASIARDRDRLSD